MAVTAKELAKKLGLSEAAVSMALNGKPGISTATRKKVIDAAKTNGYDFTRRNVPAEPAVSNGTIYFIIYKKNGAIVADTPFFSQLSEGIESGCKAAGYHMNISYLYEGDDINFELSEIIRFGCKGIILLGTEMTETEFFPFLSLRTPVVVLDTCFENLSADYVQIDNVQGSYLATCHLIRRCRNPHTGQTAQPGYLKSSCTIQNFRERADGFYKAIRRNGMSASKSLVHVLSPSVEGAYADMKELLSQGEQPARCYFADNDLIAAGALRAFSEAGFRVPEDVAVVGFDDMPLCVYVEPTLTTVHVPKQYMGRMAARRLAEIISSKTNEPVKIQIETSLVIRKSV